MKHNESCLEYKISYYRDEQLSFFLPACYIHSQCLPMYIKELRKTIWLGFYFSQSITSKNGTRKANYTWFLKCVNKAFIVWSFWVSWLIAARCSMEESEPPKSVMRAAHVAWESLTASSSEATVDSTLERGLSPAEFEFEFDGGWSTVLQDSLPLPTFSGEKILSMPPLPASHFIC